MMETEIQTEIIKQTSKLMLEVLQLPLEEKLINNLINKLADIRDVALLVNQK